MADKNKQPNDLQEALGKIEELENINKELVAEISSLETENSELKVKVVAVENKAVAIVEHDGNSYKANSSAFRNEEGTVVCFSQDVFVEKQKIFGAEIVRMATEKDIAELVKEKSNILSKIEK
jgi:hypothetical protein